VALWKVTIAVAVDPAVQDRAPILNVVVRSTTRMRAMINALRRKEVQNLNRRVRLDFYSVTAEPVGE
jgi:hypothetical protein